MYQINLRFLLFYIKYQLQLMSLNNYIRHQFLIFIYKNYIVKTIFIVQVLIFAYLLLKIVIKE